MALLNFSMAETAPDTGTPDPVPAAWYSAAMTESETKPTKAGTGLVLAAVYTILEGQFAKRKIFANYNIQNPSEIAQKIGRAQLTAVGVATGVCASDSVQLHNIPLKIKVKLTPAADGYEAKNEIIAYKNINEAVASAVAPTPVAAVFAPPPVAAAPVQAAWTPPAAAQPWAAPAQPAPVVEAAAAVVTPPAQAAAAGAPPPWAVK